MIEDQFVSFETAKLLKEAGFDIPCRGIYVTDRTGYYEFREYDNKVGMLRTVSSMSI